MSSHTKDEQQLTRSLQEDYRRAWVNFRIEMGFLRAAVSEPSQDGDNVRSARLRADRAAIEYREARNALASFLLANNPQDDESAYAVRLASEVARCQAA